MSILVISIDYKMGWAVHHNDKVKKIRSGQYHFKTITEENEEKIFERFLSFINNILYSHGEIEDIYYLRDLFVDDDLYQGGLKTLENIAFKEKIHLHILDLENIIKTVWGLDEVNEEKILTNVKTLGHNPDNMPEAYAISGIYYVNGK